MPKQTTKVAKKTAKERRQEFLRKQVLLYDLEGNINAASEVEKISKTEEMREAHREIRQALKPRNNLSLTHIEINDPNVKKKMGVVLPRHVFYITWVGSRISYINILPHHPGSGKRLV